MLLRLCQLKSLITTTLVLTLVSSCSWRRDDVSPTSELLQTFNNNWFKVNPNHSLRERNNEPSPHLFFDTTPEFNKRDRTANAIVTVPQGSKHAYTIDLNSGQRYYTHSYCKQKDIWNAYSGSIGRPVFSIGYIPRVLDQLGDPQKVIIWSKEKDYGESVTTNYHKVKLIGAYVEQICPDGNCLGKGNWLSKLVFIGVDADDKSLLKISNIDEFKKTFDWETSKAYLENIDGRNFIGDQMYPSTRVSQLIEYEDAFDYFKKRSIFLTDAELKKIQKGCHILYDRLWDDVGKIRPEDRGAKTVKELNEKIKLREKLKEERKPVGFAQRLRKFTKKYFNEISTCEKFVYHGNINRDPEAFWFLSHMGIYYRLHREGYYFDCRTDTWFRNVLNAEGNQLHDLKRDISMCNEADIDRAMDYLPNFLKSLKGEKDYYRFIDYDHHTFGTHQKMYSWVKMKSSRFDCSDDPNATIKKELRVFPEDVQWKQRDVKDIADKLKIIY